MEDLTISKGWFQDKDDEPTIIKKKFCEHRVSTVTLDYEVGIADTITVTFFSQGEVNGISSEAIGTIVTHGARVPTLPSFTTTLSELPELSTFETNKTDQFVVDLEHVVGGHPYKGLGTSVQTSTAADTVRMGSAYKIYGCGLLYDRKVTQIEIIVPLESVVVMPY